MVIMFCDNCKKDRLVTDFIKNQEFCYHCEYQKKIEKSKEKRTDKKVFCRVCDKEVIQDKNLKKRQRTVFCSLECAQQGHKELSSNYWTRQVKSVVRI